jgi:CRP/FNR family transcriptional regulator, anaerobic regulatory protein
MQDKSAFFKSIIPNIEVSDNALTEFSQLFTLRTYDEQEHFVSIEDNTDKVGFLCTGIMRSYIVDYDGNEAILRFILPKQFVSGSFASNVPSPVSIQCIEKSSIYITTWGQLFMFIKKHADFMIMFNTLLRNGHAKTVELLSKFIRLDAKERYALFMKEYPDLIHRIPHYMIANHLGITPVQLSRIRNKKNSK